VTMTQLERWRAGGYLPGNTRTGLGRGAGSQSETPAGVADYVDALAYLASQGRSMQRTMLTLFTAGVVQPQDGPADGPLMRTYEAAVRRAFQKQLEDPGTTWNRVWARSQAVGEDPQAAEDSAFREAETLGRMSVPRRRIGFERTAAHLTGAQARSAEQMRRETEQALLSVTGLKNFGYDRDEGDLTFEQAWDTGLPPLDLHIWTRPRCTICASRTTHVATSPQGGRDILDSASFFELNRAKAIGGAVCTLITQVRDAALRDPEAPETRAAIALCANTSFRFFLRTPMMVSPQHPEWIVPCTLFFTRDCAWLRSAAALLTQHALWRMPTAAGLDKFAPAKVARTITDTVGRANTIKLFKNGPWALLAADGLVASAELIEHGQSH